MTELEKLWEGSKVQDGMKFLENPQKATHRLPPSIMILAREQEEVAIIKVLKKELFYKHCVRIGTFEHIRIPGRMWSLPHLTLVIYDGRQNILDQTKMFEEMINNYRAHLNRMQLSTLSNIGDDLVIAYHHASNDFPQEVRGNADIPCFEINLETGDGILPLLETISTWNSGNERLPSLTLQHSRTRGTILFLPVRENLK